MERFAGHRAGAFREYDEVVAGREGRAALFDQDLGFAVVTNVTRLLDWFLRRPHNPNVGGDFRYGHSFVSGNRRNPFEGGDRKNRRNLALEDAQQALELAQCILETVRQEPTSGRLVGQDEASRVRLELRAAEQRVKQLDDVLRELDDCAARSH